VTFGYRDTFRFSKESLENFRQATEKLVSFQEGMNDEKYDVYEVK
jgi:hypothetical protein